MAKFGITGVKQLRDRLSLSGVQFYEVRGNLYAGGTFNDSKESGSQEVEFHIALVNDLFATRMRVTVYGELGRYRTDLAALFTLSEEIEVPSRRILSRFLETDSIPILYPFVRQSLWDTSSRLGHEEILLDSVEMADVKIHPVIHDEE